MKTFPPVVAAAKAGVFPSTKELKLSFNVHLAMTTSPWGTGCLREKSKESTNMLLIIFKFKNRLVSVMYINNFHCACLFLMSLWSVHRNSE